MPTTLVLTRSDVARLLDLDTCISAVESAFRALGEGKAPPPGSLSYPTVDGGFHIKAASLNLGRHFFVTKTNGNFFRNPERGLPRIQGVLALADADNGTPLALLDSFEITVLRTGAATGVAAKYLARPDASTVTVAGCGAQGRVQLRSVCRVRGIKRVRAFDPAKDAARRYSEEMSRELKIPVEPVTDLGSAARESDIVITCTPSQQSIVTIGDLRPGAFLAAVGADSHDKQEVDPKLMARSAVVVDNLEQCATFGDLHHAIKAGLMRREDVRAELGEVVAGRKPGRGSNDDVVIFDSTGTALQDVAAAAVVYQRAKEQGVGMEVELGG
jgi:alanine dehydrogenase